MFIKCTGTNTTAGKNVHHPKSMEDKAGTRPARLGVRLKGRADQSGV